MFKKGNNLGKGRPKGAENKEKKKLREMMTLVISNNFEKFNEEMGKLKGKQFIDAYLSMAEYCLPKLNRTDMRVDDRSKIRDAAKITFVNGTDN